MTTHTHTNREDDCQLLCTHPNSDYGDCEFTRDLPYCPYHTQKAGLNVKRGVARLLKHMKLDGKLLSADVMNEAN